MSAEVDRLNGIALTIAYHKTRIAALTPERDELVRVLHGKGLSLREIAAVAEVSHITVRDIVNGQPEPGRASELVTRTEIAARRDVHISTLMSWIDRYRDFPAPVRTDTPKPLWSWPAVEAYLDRKKLPRNRHADAMAEAVARDARILAALAEFPDGLTDRELADLTREDEPATERFGQPTDHAVEVRVNDRLRRLESAGKVERSVRSGTRRGITVWTLLPAVSTG